MDNKNITERESLTNMNSALAQPRHKFIGDFHKEFNRDSVCSDGCTPSELSRRDVVSLHFTSNPVSNYNQWTD